MAAEILLGTQGWSYPDWIGSFYPPGTKSTDFLPLYCQAFQTVELDTTFYAIPRQSAVEGWRRKSSPNFKFAAKLPQSITHEKRLVDAEHDLFAFLDVITALDDKLGPLLVQMPPDFRHGQDEAEALDRFLRLLPKEQEFAVEFRHRSWHEPEVVELLRERGVAWCVPILPYLPERVEVTADFMYVRWLGDHRKIQSFAETQIDRASAYDHWAETLRQHSAQVTRIYGYYNNHYSGHSPTSVREMQRRLGLQPGEPPAATTDDAQPRLPLEG